MRTGAVVDVAGDDVNMNTVEDLAGRDAYIDADVVAIR
ncbi:hypothetical protein C731_0960 [Mycolicibacterium hassiacum DSM 44199]|uniref:Uncharacterized protein n=1 Tax=Mycolicibacterium hassiacum (strain DSM 44199 / CIP 105218 / JCM 12690 / 3849) TaxID=1122247 RepID=K5B988_MYCHD|nr:hypothetical protein C731_0960 [Mycolicibacterium hassiacum DSM 44199]